jgi:hypothetical protein
MPTMAFLEFRLSGLASTGKPRAPASRAFYSSGVGPPNLLGLSGVPSTPVGSSRVPSAPSPEIRLQRVRCRADQTPGHAGWRIEKLDLAVEAALRHRFHNDGAEPPLLRCRHRRPAALSPAHGEGVAVGAPANIDATRVHRERPIFPSIGSEFVERGSDDLRGSCIQSQLGATHDDTRANEFGEGRELGANQVLDFDPMPLVPDEEVLICRKRLDALGEVFDEIFGSSMAV